MADWYLCFNCYQHQPGFITLEAFEGLARTILGGEGKTAIGELDGNPRDGYGRSVEVSGERDGVQLRFSTTQDMRMPDEPEPHISSVNITIASKTASFAAKLAMWQRVQGVLATLGFAEHTLSNGGSEIIDDAEAAGDVAAAMWLREAKADRLLQQAPRIAHVSLTSPRTDIEPILAAYPRAAEMASMSLRDCALTALPPSFFRFTALRDLSLEEDAFDGSILRGVSLPNLERLTLRGEGLRAITKDDLAGFPRLEILSCAGSSLERLDPAIIEVCPKLIRAYIERTPLWENEAAMAALRARWPRMLWRYHDGYVDGEKVEAPVGRGVAPQPPPAFEQRAPPPALQPFFDKILAAPDDDAPRLELAAHLTALGDKRGQQIRFACELARLEPDDPRYEELRNKTPLLPEFVFFSETRYPFLGLYQARRRGFLEHIECSGLDFVRYAEVLMRDAPIRGLTLSTAGDAEAVARCAALARLRELRLDWLPDEDRGVILGSPHLAASLQRVAVGSLDSAAAVQTLAAELRPLARLRELELRRTLTAAAAPALIALVKARHLTRLHVDFCTLKPTTLIRDLWDQLGDVVRPRRVPRVPLKDGALDLSDGGFSLEQVSALVETGAYRATRRLSLSCARIGQGVIRYFATCGAFPELEALSLLWPSDASLRELAKNAIGLDRLASIYLGEDENGDACGSDAAIAALARSPRLPALRRIERSQKHNVYAPDARDDDEIVQILRDDGAVVESVIGHWLWP